MLYALQCCWIFFFSFKCCRKVKVICFAVVVVAVVFFFHLTRWWLLLLSLMVSSFNARLLSNWLKCVCIYGNRECFLATHLEMSSLAKPLQTEFIASTKYFSLQFSSIKIYSSQRAYTIFYVNCELNKFH